MKRRWNLKRKLYKIGLLACLTTAIPDLYSGEIIEEGNEYGGKTELIIPDDTSVRKYLKNYYDETGFLMVQEERMGEKSLVEIPFFLNRTYYSKKDPTLVIIERFTNPIAYTGLDQLYKDISWFKNGIIIMAYEYYFENDQYSYKHIIQRNYRSDGSFEEKVVKES
jgi:hypothetical protein